MRRCVGRLPLLISRGPVPAVRSSVLPLRGQHRVPSSARQVLRLREAPSREAIREALRTVLRPQGHRQAHSRGRPERPLRGRPAPYSVSLLLPPNVRQVRQFSARPAIPIRTVRELLPRGSHLQAPSVRMESMLRDSPAAVLLRPDRPVLRFSVSQVLQTPSSARPERRLQGSQVLHLSVRALRQVLSVWTVWTMPPSAITTVTTAMTMP